MGKELFATPGRQHRQAYALLLFGLICLLGAWLLHLNPYRFPVGVFLLGLGMLLSTLFYPGRLIIAGSLTTAVGLAVYLGFSGSIPGGQIFPAYILALGVGLLAIALAARRGYVGKGALSPALIVIAVGLIEVLLVAHMTPPNLIPFALSLWLPGLALLVLGLLYFFLSRKPGNDR
ncbi:hypothetical protein KDA_56730 [Dictyobacter alpinus]|uniref:Uncharacterized protein n=1 Tax=Dictyobacter alpinus TaxID=2014873 RepID=A0A402BFU6_9CHLR|nr:hypothetical protein [Dictyobacter alpinus]GCE30189.1 hypothetical protein KDA_56730 [Dictyobacter alpinus]